MPLAARVLQFISLFAHKLIASAALLILNIHIAINYTLLDYCDRLSPTVVAFVATDLTIMKGVGFELYYKGILNLILWLVHVGLRHACILKWNLNGTGCKSLLMCGVVGTPTPFITITKYINEFRPS